ncbi:tRNA 2-selenouridine(34) synthase MnmH [Fictibacillus phosphorivorans]|uniref:tRNA 2-selenouridine(34) synthase MnmH n=1 Tax=Fictibacillus phosphorivorans TaxID=1221500 RepID=UPI0020405E07|nr:tRNA 2-selenouridine(34) synthase MnmH [Fictibacillus phosphorivorans]MCM3717052.1 tRNA 2-selenouridine(34) synthase MnmH [Fictibacillus phosphorivorans]MCM3774739.1 tRNA 2-selenouridine(34) synthase MnmH [Fictibacillus phosphorivorans]
MEELRTIQLNDIDSDSHLLFDVRSPKEYDEYHIPGAKCLSIFSNDERAEIGTIYKQKSKEQAVERGLEIVAPKLPNFYKTIKNEMAKYPEKQVVIYCARGGMRSKSLVQTMSMLGIDCLQLEGGIRSYRKQIERTLNEYSQKAHEIIVLEGYTGTMKTKFLEKLQEEGYPVINLEKMAGHKGSIFGRIGEEPASQKKFESRLYERLNELKKAPILIIESESKRIGRVIVPDFLLEGKYSGTRIHINIPFGMRVQYICEVYDPQLHKKEIEEAVLKLTNRIPSSIMSEIKEALLKQDYEKVVSFLLENYYDPKYEYAEQKYESPCIHVSGDSFDYLYNEIQDEINKFL